MKEALGRLGKGGPVHFGFLILASIIGEVEMGLVSNMATCTRVGMMTRPKSNDSREAMM